MPKRNASEAGLTQPTKFQLSAKNLFLTYPQCPATKQFILDYMHEIFDIDKYIVAQETHEDGNSHLHVHLKLVKRKCIKNCRYADIEYEDKVYHPNMQAVRNPIAVRKYVTKDKNYIHNYDKSPVQLDTWSEAIDLAKNNQAQDAINLVLQNEPKLYALQGHNIELNLRQLETANANKNESFTFISIPSVDRWFTRYKSKRALWLVGKPGLGKTEYAKSLFDNPLLVSHMDKLKQFKRGIHDAIIFDDMSFRHWPREPAIHIVDLGNDRDINVKCSMVTIPASTPRIFTSNRYIWPDDDTGALNRRIWTVRIDEDIRLIIDDDDNRSVDSYDGPKLNELKADFVLTGESHIFTPGRFVLSSEI